MRIIRQKIIPSRKVKFINDTKDVVVFFDEELYKTDLSVYSGDGDVWIGKEWSSIGDDETGRQFKESVKSELEKFLGPDVECETHVEEISN